MKMAVVHAKVLSPILAIFNIFYGFLTVVSRFQAIEVKNEFTATLEKRLKDVPRSDELYKIKKVVQERKLSLNMAQDRKQANTAQLPLPRSLVIKLLP